MSSSRSDVVAQSVCLFSVLKFIIGIEWNEALKIIKVIKWEATGVSRVGYGCFKGGSRNFELCFKEDRRMFDRVLSVF